MDYTTEEEDAVRSKPVSHQVSSIIDCIIYGRTGSSQVFLLPCKINTDQQISWNKSSFQKKYLELDNILCEHHPLDHLLPQLTPVTVKKLGKGGRSSTSILRKPTSIFRDKQWNKKYFDRSMTKRHWASQKVLQLLFTFQRIIKSHRNKNLKVVFACKQLYLKVDCQTDRPETRGYGVSVEVTEKEHRSTLVISEGEKALELLQTHFRQQGCCWKHTLSETMPGLVSFRPSAACSNPNLATLRSRPQNQQTDTVRISEPTKPEMPPNFPCRQIDSPQREPPRPSKHRSETALMLCKLITPLIHAHDYHQVIHATRSFQPISTSEDIQKHFAMGLAYYKLVEHDEAKLHLIQGEEIAVTSKQNGDIALCNVYLGDIEFSAGKFPSAVQCYKKATAHYSPDSVASDFKIVPPSLSIIHAKCGSALRSASKSMEAVQEYKTATRVALSDRDRLAAHTSLGNLYQSLGENTAALEEYEQAINLAKNLNDHVSLGWAHGNMGNALLGLYRKDEALFHLQKALDLAVDHEPTPQAIGRTYNNLGTAYQSMNDLTKAEEYYDLALSQAIYGNDIPGQARVYGNIGNVLMLQKDYERAIRHFSEVLQLSTDRSTRSTALHNRGCAYYEWAEKQMASYSMKSKQDKHSITASASVADTTPSKFYIHSSRKTGNEYPPPTVPANIIALYKKGSEDLEEVIKYHEETLENIKGSSKGLSLSVSLFESNSRTFHRLQDCLVRQGKYDRALLVAEQSRARTLGELMLSKHQWHFGRTLSVPLNFEQIRMIVESQSCPVVYLSYTGARLLGWVFVPHHGDVSMSMFEVPLEDDMFDGKSFDYHVRYNLTEKLVEKSFEMYQSVTYDKESSSTVQELHTLIAEPMKHILNKDYRQYSNSNLSKIVIIPDSYTSLVPFTCLLDPESGSFLGDHYYFQMMPSLLSMGILSQMPAVTVTLPASPHTFCVVGDPNIPPFHHNGEMWHLGKLPYARREAEWVAHVLKTTAILEEQATKNTVVMRIMNAKLIHFATHGSASSGFLAFGSVAPHRSLTDDKGVDATGVLLYPKEVEKLSISPALVVLSSCDSGRGTVKADGIQGMARAFILAGGQSVLTTLWRVPDESASVFMKFFYQYLMDGLKSSMALHKAILSVRCFSKYSQYIHWSGYQLTGRDIQFDVSLTPTAQLLANRLGAKSVFPRLEIVKKLKKAVVIQNRVPTTSKSTMGYIRCRHADNELSMSVEDSRLPTDVQILRGGPGLRPSEIVKDLIHSSHEHFSGGVFWINCRQPDLIHASVTYIEEVTETELDQLPISEEKQALFVFDAITELPSFDKLLKVMKNKHVHIVFTSKSFESPDLLIKQVDKELVRGCVIHALEPLSMIESTQRIVHSVMKDYHHAPNNEDQLVFEELAQFTSGSPVIVEVASKALLSYFRQNSESNLHGVSDAQNQSSQHNKLRAHKSNQADAHGHQLYSGQDDIADVQTENKQQLCVHYALKRFSEEISLQTDKKTKLTAPQFGRRAQIKSPRCTRRTRSISRKVVMAIPAISEDQIDVWDTNSPYDSWDSIEELIKSCQLSVEERLLLNTLCMFSCSPIPYSLAVEISSLIAMATHQPHITGTLSSKLLEMCLMKKYPSPVVLHSSFNDKEHDTEPEFVYIPQYISRSIWKNLDKRDHVMALSIMFQALLVRYEIAQPLEASFLLGLCGLLLEMHEFELPLMGEECYEAVHQLCERYKEKIVSCHLKDSYEPHLREVKDGKLSYTPVLILDLRSTIIVTKPISRPKADLYPMKSQEHGVALIVSNKTFNKHSELTGMDRHEENFIEAFRFLGYRVKVQHQCTKERILKLFETIDSLVKDTDDSFVCCFLSHGGEGIIYGSDSEPVPLRTERDSLETKLTECKKLGGKPKIVFAPFSGMSRKPRCLTDGDGSEDEGCEEDRDEDIAFFCSPVPKNKSLTRHDNTAAFYIDTLCRVLCQTAPNRTLSDIHEEVTKEVKGETKPQPQSTKDHSAGTKPVKQMPRDIFFFDDLHHM